MSELSAQAEALDALRTLVGIFIWYPADEDSPDRPTEPVTEVDLGDTSLDDRGARHLRAFDRLQSLCLEDTRITDAGLVHLAGLTCLKRCELRGTFVTGEGVAALQRQLPTCEIDWME
jgi:hypothetical protein